MQDVESDDEDTKEFLNDRIRQMEDTETNPMIRLKNQITKAQDEYKPNNKHPDPPMYKVEDSIKNENIIPPTHEVRMKNAREKKQEKYDKLTMKAF